jgi:hypothetical protein
MVFTSFRYSLIAIAALALATAAQAGIINFTGVDVGANGRPIPNSDAAAASFDTAASGLGTEGIIDFESAALGSFTSLTAAAGVTITGTDFTGLTQQSILNATTCTVALCGGNTTLGGSKFLFVNGGFVTFTFANPTSFFGAYLGGVQLDGETITFSDGTSQTVTIPNPGIGIGGIEFVGFTDAGKSISSIRIDTRTVSNPLGDFISVDDLRYQRGSATPEPGTLLLGAAGLLVLAGVQLRRRA